MQVFLNFQSQFQQCAFFLNLFQLIDRLVGTIFVCQTCINCRKQTIICLNFRKFPNTVRISYKKIHKNAHAWNSNVNINKYCCLVLNISLEKYNFINEKTNTNIRSVTETICINYYHVFGINVVQSDNADPPIRPTKSNVDTIESKYAARFLSNPSVVANVGKRIIKLV